MGLGEGTQVGTERSVRKFAEICHQNGVKQGVMSKKRRRRTKIY